MRFLAYNPDQAYLLPPSVKDELGEDHLCFFIHWTLNDFRTRHRRAITDVLLRWSKRRG